MKVSKAIEGFEFSRLADGYSRNTLDVYRWALDRLAEFLGDPELAAVQLSDLRRFMYYLREDYTPNRPGGSLAPLSGSSLENAWKAIRSFFGWAAETLEIDRPDLDLPKPEYGEPEIVPFSEDEIRAILRACGYTAPATTEHRRSFQMRRPTADRDRALVLVLLDTGLRASEVARLRVEDVNLQTGEVFVQPFGSGRKTKSRTVYLGKAGRAAVWKYLALWDVGSHDPVFVTTRNRPLNRSSILHLIVKLGERAEVKGAHPHRFRHTFAIQYLRNGGDVFTLQRLLGHSTLTMVKRYLTLADADAAEAHRRASPADRWGL